MGQHTKERRERDYTVICDECNKGTGAGPYPQERFEQWFTTLQAASERAYEAGWICVGKLWICNRCSEAINTSVECRLRLVSRAAAQPEATT